MKSRNRVIAVAVGLAAVGTMAFGGSAMAAFPNFSDCPTGTAATLCIDIQSNQGSIAIKNTTVPLGHSLEIRGGIDATTGRFYPPAGSNGFFAEPVQVPGGLLGIDLPISLNQVTATAELAGNASNVRLDLLTLGVSVPIKLHLTNPLIGSNCYIGSNSNPAHLNLTTGTTNPPAPNRPISGSIGTFTTNSTFTGFMGNVDVDNAFSVPGATGCGLGLGLINGVIDLRLGLPSAGGNNSMSVTTDVAIRGLV